MRRSSVYVHTCSVVDVRLPEAASAMLCAWATASVWLGFCSGVICARLQAYGRGGPENLDDTASTSISIQSKVGMDGMSEVRDVGGEFTTNRSRADCESPPQ